MRSILLVSVLAVASTGMAVHELMPEREADAKSASDHVQEIASISFDGSRIPVQQLRQQLETRVGDKLDSARLERDRGAVEASLVSQGYLAAQVLAPTVAYGAGGAAFVTFPVTTGLAFHIHAVTVTGATEREAGVLTIGRGDQALADRIERARVGLAERLGKRGVTVRQQIDLADGAVDLEFVTR